MAPGRRGCVVTASSLNQRERAAIRWLYSRAANHAYCPDHDYLTPDPSCPFCDDREAFERARVALPQTLREGELPHFAVLPCQRCGRNVRAGPGATVAAHNVCPPEEP